MQHYSSSAPEPIAALSHSAAPTAVEPLPSRMGQGSGLRLVPAECLEGFRKGVIHIERDGVLHLGVHQYGVQSRRDLIGLLAQVTAHLPDLIPVEVDGRHTLDIAAVGHLVTLVIETIFNFGCKKAGDLFRFPA